MKRRSIGRFPLLAVLVLSLGGCLAGGSEAPDQPPTGTPQPAPTSSATATELPATATHLPASPTASPTPVPLCDADDVSAFIVAFASAFNAADQERLAAMLPAESYPYAPAVPQPGMDQHQFRGFGLQTDTNDIGDRDALLLDFAARHAAGERWEVQYVVVVEVGAWRGTEWHAPELAEIGVQLIRQTADIAPYTAIGKGLVNCVDETLIYFWGGGTIPGVVVEESMIGDVAPAPRCTDDDVSAFVTAFVDAFNAGDQERLSSVLPAENYPYAPAAPGPMMDQHQFRGFSLWSSIADRDTLLREFAARHAASEQWEIQYLVITASDPRWQVPELAEFGVQLIRQADDVAPHTIVGKGMVNCIDQTLLFFFGGGDVDDGVIEESLLDGDIP